MATNMAAHVEESVLGVILNTPSTLENLVSRLRPEHFTPQSPQKIVYTEMLDMYAAGIPIDFTLLSGRLTGKEGIENPAVYLAELQRMLPDAANIAYYIDLVHLFAQKRAIIDTAAHLMDMARSGNDPQEVYKMVSALSDTLNLSSADQPYIPMEGAVSEYLAYLAERQARDDVWEIPTGIQPYDDALGGGLGKSDLIIVAARPSVGKTAYALQMAVHAATQGIPVAFNSLEMSRAQLVLRMLASSSGVEAYRIRKGILSPMEAARVRLASEAVARLPLFIDDDAALAVGELSSRSRSLEKTLHRQGGVLGLVVVDYLQLFASSVANRVSEVSQVSRSLKLLAKSLNVPVVALSQLSRAIEQRGKEDKRPKLSDLRDSGAIEQDADIVTFLTRPTEGDTSGFASRFVDVSIAKNRHGPLANFPLLFDAKATRFSVIDAPQKEEATPPDVLDDVLEAGGSPFKEAIEEAMHTPPDRMQEFFASVDINPGE